MTEQDTRPYFIGHVFWNPGLGWRATIHLATWVEEDGDCGYNHELFDAEHFGDRGEAIQWAENYGSTFHEAIEFNNIMMSMETYETARLYVDD